MPFTTSHPAIILPLKQIWPRWWSLSGLMAGAMSPDLLYFLMMGTTERSFSHSWMGLFVFCVPAGMVFAFVFHRFFKRPFFGALPDPLDRFFSGLAASPFHIRSARDWLVLGMSVLVGALSHFFWDSWTHAHGAIASRIPLFLSYITVGGSSVQVTTILQHASTLVGGGMIVWYAVTGRIVPPRLSDYHPIPSHRKRRFWMFAFLGSLLAVVLALQIWCGGFGFWTIAHADRGTLIRAIGLGSWAGFFWATCLCGVRARREAEKHGRSRRYENVLK
ncbi:MAG: DUF4184 family protein [candidate division Zixibacteria bacterium]|jgi:hypothetical protein|nr:DUF4184 family protein [candidate division Zixibacteria bacterium]